MDIMEASENYFSFYGCHDTIFTIFCFQVWLLLMCVAKCTFFLYFPFIFSWGVICLPGKVSSLKTKPNDVGGTSLGALENLSFFFVLWFFFIFTQKNSLSILTVPWGLCGGGWGGVWFRLTFTQTSTYTGTPTLHPFFLLSYFSYIFYSQIVPLLRWA